MTAFASTRVRSWAVFLAMASGTAFAGDGGRVSDGRVLGLVTGAVVGDAVGGPVEFAKREAVAKVLPGYRGQPERRVEAADLRRLAETLPLLAYTDLRPGAEPYGQWSVEAAAGTVTDDTRHKMVLIDALRHDGEVNRRTLAEAYLRFAERPGVQATEGWPVLCERSFGEFWLAARWELGERDLQRALPPSRLWGGLGTCCGQMTLTPMAALYPGEPERAYLAAYNVAWFDNGEAKDINAAIVAGLAHAIAQPVPAETPAARQRAWRAMLEVMKQTDPLRYGEVEFVDRALSKSLDRAIAIAAEAEGSPGRLYRLIDEACPHDHAWEAKFLLIETVALTELCRGEPLAAVHLALDFGQDTDSAAQLMGAWFGALYGPELFPEAMRQAVAERLEADYGESLSEWTKVLVGARRP